MRLKLGHLVRRLWLRYTLEPMKMEVEERLKREDEPAGLPYSLTERQRMNSWVAHWRLADDGKTLSLVFYLRRGCLDDPAPGIPAFWAWHPKGMIHVVASYKRGMEALEKNGRPVRVNWTSDGRLIRRSKQLWSGGKNDIQKA